MEVGDAKRKFYYATSCKVGGHGERFANYLLKRPNWRVYPPEKWFENETGWRCCRIFLLIGACPLYFGGDPTLT